MATRYVWEKLYMFVGAMASGQGSIIERMGVAAHHIRGVGNEFSDGDEDLAERFAELFDRVPGSDALASASPEELSELVGEFFSLFLDLERRNR